MQIVDNQVLRAVLERKGTSQNLALNSIGKQIHWLQELGEFSYQFNMLNLSLMLLINLQENPLV